VPLQAVTRPKQLRDGIVQLFQGFRTCYITPEDVDEELAACGGDHGQATTNLHALDAEVMLPPLHKILCHQVTLKHRQKQTSFFEGS
jgi:hypothetical protein